MAKKNIAFVDVDWLENGMRSLANSIKAKTGEEGTLSFPDGMVSAIAGIETGGGGTGESPDGYATVTFMNGDDVLFSRLVLKGDDCPDPYVQNRIELPTKESTAQYDYTFNGWATADGGSADSNVLKNITADKTIYAAYKGDVRKYTVTLCDEDGSVLMIEEVEYGKMPSYVPTKEGGVFDSWTPNTPVTSDTSYTATWRSVAGSGTCGARATWTLDSNGVLTISGTGTVTRSYTSWNNAANSAGVPITSIVVEDGITTLPESCFYNAASAVSVTLPPSIVSIGNTAFEYCENIKSLYISDLYAWCGITVSSGNYSPFFYSGGGDIYLNGEKLTEIDITSGLTSIAGRAFYYCSSLEKVRVGGTVTELGIQAFYGCANLSQVELCDGITTLGRYALGNDPKLLNITIPDSVVSIEGYAFGGSGLTSATFEDTEGWDAGGTALASADLANPTTAATYLKTTHMGKTWTKS